jgi:hypothetical protein
MNRVDMLSYLSVAKRLMAAPYYLGFRATALTLRAGWHSQPLIAKSLIV